MLLHIIKGPTSFEHLRTVQGVVYNTYQAACKAMGLLEDDSHWENTLSEAAVCSSAMYIIKIFICRHSNVLSSN